MYAAIPGAMVGFGMTIPHYCTYLHFPNKFRTFSTIYIVSFFAAPTIPNLFINYIANPNDLPYIYSPLDGEHKFFPDSVAENTPKVL